jgi:aspartyl-tRNA(Asn)/glutamyl-tRNA(Gln) amidotransferase subunit B
MSGAQYEPIIGLEVHAELLTNSKMFCGCSADYSSAPEPNTFICPVCTGLPGAMPVVNKKAVEQAILVGLALNCSINEINTFARKNYYYPDLPKGYQVSQYDLPIASDGWLEVMDAAASESARIRVRRAHLEEDTAKSFHQAGHTLIDFNRAGVPLLEIVTEPDMRTVEAALAYAAKIRAILRYLGVNSGDMEKGVLRFEANVSVRPIGSDEFRTRTEIKNLNSFRALARASAYEIERQIKAYENGDDVIQETLGWDDARGVTVSQRSKEHAHDYRYFPEPDLPPLQIDRAKVESIKQQLPELPDAKIGRFVRDYELKPAEAALLAAEKALADYFENVVAHTKSPAKVVNNWVAGEFLRNTSDLGIEIEDVPVQAAHLAQLIDLVSNKKINSNTGKTVLGEMFKTGRAPDAIVDEKGLSQISDGKHLEDVIARILNDNPKEVTQYLNGKETLLQWFMGQIARATQGKADPQAARDLLTRALDDRKAGK